MKTQTVIPKGNVHVMLQYSFLIEMHRMEQGMSRKSASYSLSDKKGQNWLKPVEAAQLYFLIEQWNCEQQQRF